ncbi:polysaccharide pyruvyl transferase [Niallia circulans]|uniref:polysaccharide pyruvyl transferase family protein n=1 Tax=Niallia circulans TaxID=1397 RepID=UPI00148F493D|nr:polysaccharide pyruvyl transferase family protein [Niallia circulans]QJX64179.1 polysaccharide pyruvyl transferase [Niallia circulans]
MIITKIKKKVIWSINKLKAKTNARIACNRLKNSEKPNILLVGTPEHGNLGDQAITFAERKFLNDNFEDFNIVELQFSEVKYCKERLKNILKKRDIIMLHGGGNLGIEYPAEEELRRDIINNFKNQKIILFPQTIYFEDSDNGEIELEKTREIYSSHNDLTLIAREKKSYSIMKNTFKNNRVILTPDIVMYLNQSNVDANRKDVLFCFRNDVESILDENFKKQIIALLSSTHNVIISDTVVNYSIKKNKRDKELKRIWSAFNNSKLVITDRLHGMVFAAITSTPCIVFSNYNHKVKGTYNWLKHLSYIKFVENRGEVFQHIDELLNLTNSNEVKYDNNFSKPYYEEILKCINDKEVPSRQIG